MPPPSEGAGTRRVRPGRDRSERGDDRLKRRQVSDVQRARMLSAMAEVVCESGVGNVTVARVVARSGVSRRTFYEHFADREECFLETVDEAIGRMAARVVPAYRSHERWRDRIRAALAELLAFLDEQPALGGLLVVQVLGAGPAALERRQRLCAQAIGAIDEGRTESKRGTQPPPLTAEGLLGAAFSIVHSRYTQDMRPPLRALTPQLMSLIVLPYLGAVAARRELQRPPSSEPVDRSAATNGLSRLRDLEMRLTYRTVCVLLAIGSHPGSSNREVADEADIHDQGQVSKLLHRLQDLGLVRNNAERVKGEPNAWTLTERGAAVREAIAAQISLQ